MLNRIASLPIWVRLVVGVGLVLGVAIAGLVGWSSYQQERAAIAQARQFSAATAEIIETAMTTLMLSGEIEQEAAFVAHLREGRGLESIEVLRGEPVERQFGPRKTATGSADDVIRRVLTTGAPYSQVEDIAGRLVHRSVVPLVAEQSARIDCVKCHQVEAGTVLGAIDLRVGLDGVQRSIRTFQRAAALIGVVLLALLLAGAYVLIARTVTRPLLAVVGQLHTIAEGGGDLTARLDVHADDEIGRLARSFNRFTDTLHDILAQVRRSAQQVSVAAQELSSASEQVSAGVQEQSSSLEETAASLEEINASIRTSADHARQANELAGGSRESAEKGGRVVEDAVAGMAGISGASKKIAEIIGVIDEIAFQTNLLALNAAVEAARAGEQGRGFAVVAAEVRNLAQRSAGAAKEIKALILDAGQKVEDGTTHVTRAGQTLEEILTSVKRVSGVVADMAGASQEQATGIGEVTRAVTQIDSVTQRNAAQAEELASTATELANHAQQLQTLVGRFKLEHDDHVAVTAPAPVTSPPAPPAVHQAPRPRVRAERREPALAAASRDGGFEEF